jgi:hypothetical protein
MRATWIPVLELRVIGSIAVRVTNNIPGATFDSALDTYKMTVFILICPAGMFFADIFLYDGGHSVGAKIMIDMDNSFNHFLMPGIEWYECA